MSPQTKLIVMWVTPFVLVALFLLIAPFEVIDQYINRQTGHCRSVKTYFGFYKAQDFILPEGLTNKKSELTAPDVWVPTSKGTWRIYDGQHDAHYESFPRGKQLFSRFYKLFEFRNTREFSIPEDIYKEMYRQRLALWNSEEIETVSDERIKALRDEANQFSIKKNP